MYKKFITMFLIVVSLFCTCTGCSKTTTKAPMPETKQEEKIVGTDKITGIVNKVEQKDNTVYLTITSNNEHHSYYMDVENPMSKDILKLKENQNVNVKYITGTPKEYGKAMAMPLREVQISK